MRFAKYYIIAICLLAFLSKYVANEKSALIPYSAETIDLQNANFVGPFEEQQVESVRFRHWLGTDGLGRDTLAGLMNGCRIAILIGVGSMFFALLIGIPLGVVMGYFGDKGGGMSLLQYLLFAIISFYLVFLLYIMSEQLKYGALTEVEVVVSLIGYLILSGTILYGIGFLTKNMKKYPIPIDTLGMRFIEVFKSLPALFLLLAILSLSIRPGIFLISFIIGLLRWPTIARYVRAEVWKVKNQDYIKSAFSLGLSKWKIVTQHILPNALSPVIITIAFGIAGAILIESALSFLGLGLSSEEISWGKMLSEARYKLSAWWLILFPGAAIFATVYSCNIIGAYLTQKLNPRNIEID